MLWVVVLYVEVCIEIIQGVDLVCFIGVVLFQWVGQGVVLEDVGGIVVVDLCNSGKFNLLDCFCLLQQLISVQEVQFVVWFVLGIDVVVVGQVM